jgi:hypothetical protein
LILTNGALDHVIGDEFEDGEE